METNSNKVGKMLQNNMLLNINIVDFSKKFNLNNCNVNKNIVIINNNYFKINKFNFANTNKKYASFLFNTTAWWSYFFDYKLNLFNKKSKHYGINYLNNNTNLLFFKKNNLIIKNNLNFNINSHLTNQLFVFNNVLKQFINLPTKNNLLNLVNNLWLNYNNKLLMCMVLRWSLGIVASKLPRLYYKNDYNKLKKNYTQYKLLLNVTKINYNNKLKIFKHSTQYKNLFKFNKYKKKYNLLNFFINIRFLWRSQLTINLIILYLYLYTNKNLIMSSTVLLNYIQTQLRVVFSKNDQKSFLNLFLLFNKIFITKLNTVKYNYFNELLLLQLIITGRWQRKRWVTPFPKYYKSGIVKFSKLYNKYNQQDVYLSYKTKKVFTRKGVIGLRVFLFFKVNDILFFTINNK